MAKTASKLVAKRKRQMRGRNRIKGTADRPRLNVFRSLKHIYAQMINDDAGETLVAASSKELEKELKNGKDIEAAKAVGSLIAERALDKGIDTVIFDKAGYSYQGRVKALAEAARDKGLKF